MGQNFWQYCKVNATFLRAWKFILLAVLLEFGRLFCHFRRFTFHRCLSCAGTPRRFFSTIFLQQRLSHLHCQDLMYMSKFQDRWHSPHTIPSTVRASSIAFCPQPHHPLRSINNVTTSRNIYIPPPHSIQSVTPTMFASSMNVNIPPHTIHCVASTMIMPAIKFKDRLQRWLRGSLRTVITFAPPHHIHCIHISTVCARLRNCNIPPPHHPLRSIQHVCKFKERSTHNTHAQYPQCVQVQGINMKRAKTRETTQRRRMSNSERISKTTNQKPKTLGD